MEAIRSMVARLTLNALIQLRALANGGTLTSCTKPVSPYVQELLFHDFIHQTEINSFGDPEFNITSQGLAKVKLEADGRRYGY